MQILKIPIRKCVIIVVVVALLPPLAERTFVKCRKFLKLIFRRKTTSAMLILRHLPRDRLVLFYIIINISDEVHVIYPHQTWAETCYSKTDKLFAHLHVWLSSLLNYVIVTSPTIEIAVWITQRFSSVRLGFLFVDRPVIDGTLEICFHGHGSHEARNLFWRTEGWVDGSSDDDKSVGDKF